MTGAELCGALRRQRQKLLAHVLRAYARSAFLTLPCTACSLPAPTLNHKSKYIKQVHTKKGDSPVELQLPLYIEDIKALLPHRYPFLLIDRVTHLVPGKEVTGYKMVTANEPHFPGHFPEFHLMPGVLITEALAQLGGIAVMAVPEMQGKRPMLAGLDEFRFRGQVRPGDKLDMHVTIDRLRGNMGKGHGAASVDGQVVAEGSILFALA